MRVVRRDRLAPKDRSGHLYYARLNSPIGVLYKLGYTKLGSVQERFGFKGHSDEQMIDRVLCFVHLSDAYDVEQLLHAHFSDKLAFGKYSAIEDMPLFKNGQSELYCEDVLLFDDEFSSDKATITKERARLASYTRAWGSEDKARQMIRSHNAADRIAKVLGTVLFWTIVYPVSWVVYKAFKIDPSKDPSVQHIKDHSARVAATIDRIRLAEAARRAQAAA